MSASKIETWLKAGYELLGAEGTDGIKIERLARILRLNKSGFYYYFGTMHSYVKSLLDFHVLMAKSIAAEMASCKNIEPELLHLLVKHKTFFLVESQLLVKRRPAHVDCDLDEAGKIIIAELLPLVRKTTDLPEDATVAMAYLNIISYFFYARIDEGNFNYEFLHTLTAETKSVLEKVRDVNSNGIAVLI